MKGARAARRPPDFELELSQDSMDLDSWVALYVQSILALEKIVTVPATPEPTPTLARAS